jgi:hypothetical protein
MSAGTPSDADLGFTWRRRKSGEVQVLHHGTLAATLRGTAADEFLAEVADGDDADAQQLMARVTGNYKHGNERQAADHPRNRRREP